MSTSQTPVLTEAQAIEACRLEAEKRGWTFSGEIEINGYRGTRHDKPMYEVITNKRHKGCNARFTVDATTGEVYAHSFFPR